MVKTNHGIIGEQYIKNEDDIMAVSDEKKKLAWKSYHEKFLNT